MTEPVDGECRIPSALAKAIANPFDLTTGPMVRVTLLPLDGKQEHILVISMHYAVTDGWSAGVLFKDISAAYNALKLGKGKACMICPVAVVRVPVTAITMPQTSSARNQVKPN